MHEFEEISTQEMNLLTGGENEMSDVSICDDCLV